MDRESLRLLLAQGLSIEKIARRFGRHPSTVSYWMEKHGLEAANRDRHAPKGGLERERLVELVAGGASIGQIAADVGRSKGTVRHWLRRYGLKTDPSRRAIAAREARAAGILAIRRPCPRHGESEFVLEGRGYYRCKRCRAESIAGHRRRLKLQLVQEAGGGVRSVATSGVSPRSSSTIWIRPTSASGSALAGLRFRSRRSRQRSPSACCSVQIATRRSRQVLPGFP